MFLKKATAAVADGDQILGVIAATAASAKPKLHSHLRAPNAPSLSDLFV